MDIYNSDCTSTKTSGWYTTTAGSASVELQFEFKCSVSVKNGERALRTSLGVKKRNDGIAGNIIMLSGVISTPSGKFTSNMSLIDKDSKWYFIKSRNVSNTTFTTIWESEVKTFSYNESSSIQPIITFNLGNKITKTGNDDGRTPITQHLISLSDILNFKDTSATATFNYSTSKKEYITNPGSAEDDGNGTATVSTVMLTSNGTQVVSPTYTRDNEEETGSYTVKWLTWEWNQDKTKKIYNTGNPYNLTTSDYIYDWVYNGFKWSNGSSTIACGTNFKLSSDVTYTTFYNEPKQPKVTLKPTIGGLLDGPDKPGYKFSRWYYEPEDSSNLTVVAANNTVTGDTSVYAHFKPITYKIKFDISDIDLAYDSEGKVLRQTAHSVMTKTYDTNLSLSKVENPIRNGYNFAGWYCEDDDSIVFTTEVNYDFTTIENDTVTLKPKWEYANRVINYNYYTMHTSETDKTLFNIDEYSGTERKYDPDKKYSTNPTDDYVFLGWAKEKPTGWDNCRGVYNNIDLIDKTLFFPDFFTFDKTKKWNTSETVERYGVWTSTGKFVKIYNEWDDPTGGNGWRRISVAYVKTENGWKACENFYYNDSYSWKHEVNNAS